MFLLTALLLLAGETGGDGTTALIAASERDDLAAVERLLKDGADVNAANDLGVTALWAASQSGNAAVVRRLLDAGAQVNAALLSGETPLMIAARGGYFEVVRQLLAKGASVDARGTRRQTALMWAAARKHPQVVRLLLEQKPDVHARSESWSMVMAVPPHGYRPYNRAIPHGNDTALLFAARSGDLESARLLVSAGADVNDADAWGVTATMFAAHSGYGDLVEFFLEKGADANKSGPGFTALHQAIMRRDEKMVAALLAHGADANAALKTWTPTRRSSKDFHFMPALVGASPFWLAARFTEPGVMRLLARHGADPKFVHRSETVTEAGFQLRVTVVPSVMAALGTGGGTAWVQPAAAEREALTLETVKVLMELGVEVRTAEAIQAATALKFASVAKLLAAK